MRIYWRDSREEWHHTQDREEVGEGAFPQPFSNGDTHITDVDKVVDGPNTAEAFRIMNVQDVEVYSSTLLLVEGWEVLGKEVVTLKTSLDAGIAKLISNIEQPVTSVKQVSG